MATMIEMDELISMLKMQTAEEMMEATDQICSPGDVFLAVTRLRNLPFKEAQDIAILLMHEKSDFHQRLKCMALMIAPLQNDLDLLFADSEDPESGLFNHYFRYACPPETSVRELCKAVVRRMGW